MVWKDVPLDEDLLLNVTESALRRDHAAFENCYRNDVRGVTRFPGLRRRIEIPGNAKVFLYKYRGDMMAVSAGQLYRIGRNSTTPVNVTGVAIAGGRRPSVAITEDEMILAAGGKLVRFAGNQTQLLSPDAPSGATHVVFQSGYVIANEPSSGRFYHTSPGQYRDWDPLDVFTAESKSDHINGIYVTPRNEILITGDSSIERWEPFASGSQPFYQRGTSPEGLLMPDTFLTNSDGNFGINEAGEYVQFLDQYSTEISDRVQKGLAAITDWSDAWAAELRFGGEKWHLLQAPNATNDYGTSGITLLFDVRKEKWSMLYSWDASEGLPVRWPGWSHLQIWQKHYIGGEGCIYELDATCYNNAGVVQRMLVRTAHFDENGGRIDITDSRMRLRRGQQAVNTTPEPRIFMRVNRDNQGLSSAIEKSLGAAGRTFPVVEYGNLGECDTVQVEFIITDEVPVDISTFQIDRSVLSL
jgi:hypothetical protein